MISVAFGGQPVRTFWQWEDRRAVAIEGKPITFGRFEAPDPVFDPEAPENSSRVLVKVRAFSCNYRDKALLLLTSSRFGDDDHSCMGSELVGEVLAVGAGVTAFRPGDRVIGDNRYPTSNVPGLEPGVPTNEASQRLLVLHEAKLIRIPASMSDEVAAGFSIGAQTAYSILRRAGVAPGSRVLVTAARSNTSLFLIQALRLREAEVYAMTRSTQFAERLRRLGVREVIPAADDREPLQQLARRIGGFDCVLDPFFDLHLGRVVEVMAPEAAYVTCGRHDQHSPLVGQTARYPAFDLNAIMERALLKNLRLLGNCLGTTEDLKQAIDDHGAGRLAVEIDSVFEASEAGAFFERTYNSGERFGKVICRYPP